MLLRNADDPEGLHSWVDVRGVLGGIAKSISDLLT
jgi:hypothetical protein